MGRERRNNVQWLEGVRGMASLIVVTTHLCRAWDYNLWSPMDNENAAPRLQQLPFLRLPWQGRMGVTMFAFLTGYVCALKPIRLVRSGRSSEALSTTAKSAFRRGPRLVLPATIAMFIAWTLAQFGGYTVAKRCDSEWLRASSPDVFSLGTEIPRFFHNLQSVWLNGRMEYDDHQWALLPLLKGAFTVYMTLCATVFMKFHYRLAVYAGMYTWFWLSPADSTETFPCQMFFGMFLCDLGSESNFQNLLSRYPRARRFAQIYLIIIGIYVASFPAENAHWSWWSRQLLQFAELFFPAGANFPKMWTAIGWQMCATAIWMSPSLQNLFSNRIFLWIGRNSFAVYLVHGTLLRVILVRMIYGWKSTPWDPEFNEQGEIINDPYLPRAGHAVFAVAIPAWFCLVYTSAYLWTNYVDSWCASVTMWIEKKVFEEDEKNALSFA